MAGKKVPDCTSNNMLMKRILGSKFGLVYDIILAFYLTLAVIAMNLSISQIVFLTF